MLRILSLTAAAMTGSAFFASAAVFQDAGFSDTLIPDYTSNPRPYVDIPTDTTAVSEKEQREAQLSCFETSPVFRACNCDILTWDSCGNPFSLSGQEQDWEVVVTNTLSKEVSRLVSPILFLQSGVARFYFTPTTIGPYNVSVSRKASSTLPPVTLTGSNLEAIVMVHDVTATCSQRTLGTMLPQFQDLLWAHSQFLNEQSRNGGTDKYSKPTDINIDRYGVYEAKDGILQQSVRRDPIQQFKREVVIPRQPPEDNNMHMCDMVRRTHV